MRDADHQPLGPGGVSSSLVQSGQLAHQRRGHHGNVPALHDLANGPNPLVLAQRRNPHGLPLQ
eukprot:1006542-Pyramimonas_sp.AAC.1